VTSSPHVPAFAWTSSVCYHDVAYQLPPHCYQPRLRVHRKAPGAPAHGVYDPHSASSVKQPDRPDARAPGLHRQRWSSRHLCPAPRGSTGPTTIAEQMSSWSRWTSHSPQYRRSPRRLVELSMVILLRQAVGQWQL